MRFFLRGGVVLRIKISSSLWLAFFLVSGAGAAGAEDCAGLFESRQVVTLTVALDPSEWERLGSPGVGGDGFHGARLTCADGRTLSVGVRRGAGGDASNLPTLDIAVDRFVPGQSLGGETAFSLVAGEGKPEGVKRAFINLVVNDRFAGLYTAVPGSAGGNAPAAEGQERRSVTIAKAAHNGAHVVINEVLANTPGGDDVEYIELYNAGTAPQDLTGWYVLDDDDLHDPCPLAGILAPGDYLIVPGFSDLFLARYPDVTALNPSEFDSVAAGRGFGLGNGGDTVRLFRTVGTAGELVDLLTYGRQGVNVSFGYRPHDSDAAEYLTTPTPAASNDASALHSPICINEFLTTSFAGGVDDWIELYNRGNTTVDIGGWFLSDSAADPLRYMLPPGTTLPPGGFHTVTETILGFSLSSTGTEVILLTAADGATGQDYFDFAPQFADVSQGRFPDGSPNWHFFVSRSPGATNNCGAGPSPPSRITGLVFASPTTLTWNPASGADAYDVIQGDLTALRDAHGDFSSAVSTCAANNRTQPTAPAPFTPAAPGEGRFYLARGVHFACGFGSYDTGSASQASTRDAGIAAEPAACP